MKITENVLAQMNMAETKACAEWLHGLGGTIILFCYVRYVLCAEDP